jgi:hypothetical protein
MDNVRRITCIERIKSSLMSIPSVLDLSRELGILVDVVPLALTRQLVLLTPTTAYSNVNFSA